MANADRAIMPLLCANRSPRFCSCLGRKPSRAKIEPSNGKPLKPVLAAKTKINAVTKAINPANNGKSLNTAFAI